ncbi:MAG: thiopurine S-methyltransferase [Formivibrio sp.]|nr:thiopurine S-methyltransferase [Formivibrio sp.]
MSNKLWKAAWKNNQIDFHQPHINHLLQAYCPALALADNANVFVPLCGKSADMTWLLAQNCRVTGVEVSPVAVAAFFQANELIPHKTRQGKLTRWHCDKVDIFCGDFFDLGRIDLAEVSAVYDRAALLALNPDMRKRYVQHLIDTLPQPCPILLLTTEYPDADMQDAPFAIADEILALYQESFSIELLHGEHGFETHPGQGHTATERTEEKVYLLRALG